MFNKYKLLLLLRNNPSTQQSKVLTISLEGQKKKKDRKTRKSRNEEKVLVLVQPPYSLQGNGSQSPRMDQGDRSHGAKDNLGG